MGAETAQQLRNSDNQLRFGVVVLAAGCSSRMGRNKLLLPWYGTTVLAHLAAQWRRVGASQVTAVFAPGSEVERELQRLGKAVSLAIPNPDSGRGMFSSIQCAARFGGWSTSLTHWAFSLGDQPHLRHATLTALVSFATVHPDMVCQPVWNNRPAHPVILPRSIFDQISESRAGTFRGFLETQPTLYCPVRDPGLGLDLDTPEDYEAALRLPPE